MCLPTSHLQGNHYVNRYVHPVMLSVRSGSSADKAGGASWTARRPGGRPGRGGPRRPGRRWWRRAVRGPRPIPRSSGVPSSTRWPGRGPRCAATTSPPRCWPIPRTSATPPAPRSCRSGPSTRPTATCWCRPRASPCCGSTPLRRPSSSPRTPGSRRARRRAGRSSGAGERAGERAALFAADVADVLRGPRAPGRAHRRRPARRVRVPRPAGGGRAPRAGAARRRAGARRQGGGGDRADPPLARRVRRRRGRPLRGAAPGDDRERGVGAPPRCGVRARCRVRGVSVAVVGAADEPVVPRGERPADRARRPGGVRHRPDRAGRLPGRPLPHVPGRFREPVGTAAPALRRCAGLPGRDHRRAEAGGRPRRDRGTAVPPAAVARTTRSATPSSRTAAVSATSTRSSRSRTTTRARSRTGWSSAWRRTWGSRATDEGAKLEEQVLVTAAGVEVLSRAPHDERLAP